MSSLNKLIEMDHEVGKSTSPPKLLKGEDYFWWKERFEAFAKYNDIRMWICISEGYDAPTYEFEGKIRVHTFSSMKDEQRRMYEAENKALSALTMCLPQEIKHTFRKYGSSQELWLALQKRFEGNAQIKESRAELLTKQFYVFKHMKGETLEDIITRYYHLMTELDNNNLSFSETIRSNKLLESLPPKWDVYTLMIKESNDYHSLTLDEVIGKLRVYDLNMQKKETAFDHAQDPSVYHGTKSNSPASTSNGVAAFYTGKSEADNAIKNSEGEICYIASSGDIDKDRNPTSGISQGFKSMSMSMSSAESHMVMLASFVASHENFIQGKVTDPAMINEDYDQIDPDDLEEMDLQWQLAMLARRTQRFVSRTGRKFVGGKAGFDKTKVKCYNCDGFGHFARECQRPKREQTSNQGRQGYNFQGNSSRDQNSGNNSNSRALVVQGQEGSYDWSTPARDSHAFAATVDGAASDEEADRDSCRDEEKIESSHSASETSVIRLESTEGLNTTDFIAYMANLDAEKQKVLLNLDSVVNVCILCTNLSGQVKELIESSSYMTTQLKSLKEENVILKQHNFELKSQSRSDATDIKTLQDRVNEQSQIINLAREHVSDLTRQSSQKEKDLADAKVKIAELNQKLELRRFSTNSLDNLLNVQKRHGDLSGLGYQEIPPPLNHNYSFVNEPELSQTIDSVKPTTVSEMVNTIKSEKVESNNRDDSLHTKASLNSSQKLKKKVSFVSDEDREATLNSKEHTPKIESVTINRFENDKQTEPSSSLTSQGLEHQADSKVSKKASGKRSCFVCHQKGHVASVCPNKHKEVKTKQVKKDQSPVKTSSSLVQVPSPVKTSLDNKLACVFNPAMDNNTNENTEHKGKAGLGYRKQSSVSKTRPVKSNTNSSPKRTSPLKGSSVGKSIRSKTPQRFVTPNNFQKAQLNDLPVKSDTNDSPKRTSPSEGSSIGKSTRSKTPQRFTTPNRSMISQNSSNRSVTNSNSICKNKAKATSNPRQVNQRLFQKSPDRKPSGSTSQASSRETPREFKSPNTRDGYLKEFTFVDEQGRPKTVVAWVPRND